MAHLDLLARSMWTSIGPAAHSSDLVVGATLRLFPFSPLLFLLVSLTAAALALFLASRNSLVLRRQLTGQADAVRALAGRERRLRLALVDSDDALIRLEPVRSDDGTVYDFTIVDANAQATALFRRAPSSIVGLHASTLTGLAPEMPIFRVLSNALERGKPHRAEVRVNPRLITTSWLWMRAVPMEGGLSVTLADIRERKREAARLRRASMTDELTGLINRRAFLDLAERRLKQARSDAEDALLFFVDCDHFKQINDTHGHQTGDRALKEIARALRGSIRDTDFVARMGGDEFTILAVDTVGDCADTIRDRVNEQLDAINRQLVLPAFLSVSMGHVYVPAAETRSLEDLLEIADRDLYERKRTHRAARSAMAAISSASVSPNARKTGGMKGKGARAASAPTSRGELTGVAASA